MCLQGSAGIVDDDLTLIDFLFFFTTELAQLPLLMVCATGFLQRRVGLSTTALQHWMGYCNMYVALFYKAVTGAKHEIYSNFYQSNIERDDDFPICMNILVAAKSCLELSKCGRKTNCFVCCKCKKAGSYFWTLLFWMGGSCFEKTVTVLPFLPQISYFLTLSWWATL